MVLSCIRFLLPPTPGCPEGIAGAEEAVDEARQELQTAQLEHREVTTQLQALLEKATELGLKTKVRNHPGTCTCTCKCSQTTICPHPHLYHCRIDGTCVGLYIYIIH